MASSPALSTAGRPLIAGYVEFVSAWIRNPLQTASVLPSSRYLAELMIAGVEPGKGRVIELGGGTGVFTSAILKLGVASSELEVVEINEDLAHQLRLTFPEVSIIEADAGMLSRHVAAAPGDYQAVVSGLPLLAMRRAQQRGILAEAFSLLADDGAMYQFTYSTKCPVNAGLLDELGLASEQTGFTWRNFPPARVFRFTRRTVAARV
ncbi:MAG TPA: phospholipid methyltransferase [Sphingomonadaceae bacterium]|nr:phospholipid methyltransferase [Sphingomonadaceae bacterium]